MLYPKNGKPIHKLMGFCPHCLREGIRLEQKDGSKILLTEHLNKYKKSCPGSGRVPAAILHGKEIQSDQFVVESRVMLKLPFNFAIELGELIMGTNPNGSMKAFAMQLLNLSDTSAEPGAYDEPEPAVPAVYEKVPATPVPDEDEPPLPDDDTDVDDIRKEVQNLDQELDQ